VGGGSISLNWFHSLEFGADKIYDVFHLAAYLAALSSRDLNLYDDNLLSHLQKTPQVNNIVMLAKFLVVLLIVSCDAARYSGKTYKSVNELYKTSNGKLSHNSNEPGSPLSNIRPGIIYYSRNSIESALKNKDITMRLMHLLLQSAEAQAAFRNLNGGADQQTLSFTRSRIQNVIKSSSGLLTEVPEMFTYRNGLLIAGSKSLSFYVIVLRHELGQKKNDFANVFIQAAYPQ